MHNILYDKDTILDKVRLDSKCLKDIDIFVIVMNGAAIYSSFLLTELVTPSELVYINVKSYDGMVRQQCTIEPSSIEKLNAIKNKNVVIIDEIVDSGKTVEKIIDLLKKHNKFVKVCSFLRRRSYKKNIFINDPVIVDDDDWLCGFGMDYENKYRNILTIFKIKK